MIGLVVCLRSSPKINSHASTLLYGGSSASLSVLAIDDLSVATGMRLQQVFDHMKDLLGKNMVEISGYAGREAVFKKVRR